MHPHSLALQFAYQVADNVCDRVAHGFNRGALLVLSDIAALIPDGARVVDVRGKELFATRATNGAAVREHPN